MAQLHLILNCDFKAMSLQSINYRTKKDTITQDSETPWVNI
jgi:hypothetical protein